MNKHKFVNNTTGVTLGAALTIGGMTATLAAGMGARLPVLNNGDHYLLTIATAASPETAYEVVRATGCVGDVLTITARGVAGTAQAWASGSKVECRIPASTLNAITSNVVDTQQARTVRQVANGTMVCNTLGGGGFNYQGGRWPHIAKDTISDFQLVFANWAVVNQVEVAGTATRDLLGVSVEYPAGVYTRVTFSGNNLFSIPSDGEAISDPIPLVIPEGAKFWTRTTEFCSGGVFYQSSYGSDGTGRFQTATTALPDYTMGGGEYTAQGRKAGKYGGPIAIIGLSAKPAFATFGDSILAGFTDTGDRSMNTGPIGRLLGGRLAHLNLSVPGIRLTQYLAGHSRRTSLINRYAQAGVVNTGINDAAAGSRTAAQINADTASVLALYPNIPVGVCTLLPFTTSSDAYVTVANQTVGAAEAVRLVVNATRRNGLAGAACLFDLARAAESGYNSGFWNVETGTISPATPAWTDDGTHPNITGNMGILHTMNSGGLI